MTIAIYWDKPTKSEKIKLRINFYNLEFRQFDTYFPEMHLGLCRRGKVIFLLINQFSVMGTKIFLCMHPKHMTEVFISNEELATFSAIFLERNAVGTQKNYLNKMALLSTQIHMIKLMVRKIILFLYTFYPQTFF